MIAALFWCGSVVTDRRNLGKGLIRFHVVANSDTEMDQEIKLQVRDAVLESLKYDLSQITDVAAAKAYLMKNLPKIQKTAEDTLNRVGVDSHAVVTLCRETFDERRYDTFALPAGVYESLRIVIGEGKGHNWWCVTFPALCVPDSEEAFVSAAVGAGFSENLGKTLAGEETYEVRFYLLDKLGQLENIFFAG